MEAITDKPDWTTKIWKDEITDKWESEILQSGLDVSELMVEYILKELRWKAQQYAKTGIITAFDPGVVKSDTVIPQDLQQKLRDAVKPLEEVSEEQKDYHPGSGDKVVDLVHPSLFPLVYGRTRVLRDSTIDVANCFSSIGQGTVAEIAEDTGPAYPGRRIAERVEQYSKRFQWLPCNVDIGQDGECRIVSYINNLHPAKHMDLYHVIEQIITRTIPLWNISITRLDDLPRRIHYHTVEYPSDEEPEPEWNPDPNDRRYEEWSEKRQPKQPEPHPRLLQPPMVEPPELVDLRNSFRERGLQIIVKLANIELTPEKPDYEGGSWHVEGQLNERICATAIYYYDSENITENTLSFRHRADLEYVQDVSYEQGQFQFLRVFGFEPDSGYHDEGSSITQELGGVSCRTGRLLTFPNTLQHRVSPFSLADRSKPGHRKILALFLIDPNRRIISTANVPPQREDWCNNWIEAANNVLASRLPVELQDMIHENLDFTPMTMDEAKAYRQELMDERAFKSASENDLFTQGGFNLCEH
ncbi:DUF4246 domain-containing protein [Aspergillus mulundensis]|uniref:DUF4246 domain-containing protein n=1 Tax=Aspergillus mulundensis TaxID=1810919 RepID=A0A3D8T2Z7_9EURO|nr:Uncharacterized protein DSM5745_00246 [Aspergillus mulundensis]RDW92924.1 Uncharacterized protein DSM5745_00246 [Aspergillus mulundensis]